MRYWVLAGILLVAFLVQSVLATYLSIGEVVPDLLLVVVLSYGLLFGWQIGLGAGMLGGLLLDLNTGRFIGLHVLTLGLVGLVSGVIEEKVFKDNLLLAPAAGFVGSMASHSIVVLALWLFGWKFNLAETLRSTILPAALYDMVLAAIVYGRIYKYYLYLKPDPRGTIVIRRH